MYVLNELGVGLGPGTTVGGTDESAADTPVRWTRRDRNERPLFPAWVRVVDRVHGCGRSAASIGVDGAVVAAAALSAEVAAPGAAALALGVLAAFHAARVYGHRSTLETQGVLWYPPLVATPLTVVVAFGTLAAPSLGTSGGNVIRFGVIAALALLLLRAVCWSLLSWSRRSGVGLRWTVVVGRGQSAHTVVEKLRHYPEAGLWPVGVLSPDGVRESGWGVGAGALPADLPAIIRHGGVTHVVLAPHGNDDVGVAECLELCDGLDVSFSMLPPLADLFLRPGLITQVGGLPLIALGKVTRTRSAQPGKRIFDLLVASVLLVLSLPAILITAMAIKLEDGGPLFYRQRRVGQGGEPFLMLKFRSMVVGADRMVVDLRDRNVTDGLLFKLRDDPRVTTVGRVLRRLSVDELPQLWNVLRGEMSLVGPRPLPVEPEEFGALDGKRHSVPPGITGYWQIAGGTGLTYREMVKLDLSYIQNWSLWLDLRLLLRTAPALLTRHLKGPC